MASKVDICNIALSRIGRSTITSLSDSTIEARLCNVMFEEIAKEVMSEGAFSSTIRRAVLNQTTTTPAFEFDYEFQLPTNPLCLRVLAIDEEYAGCEDFVIEGDKLLANVSIMEIKYIAYLTNSGEYGEQLKRVITSRLTAELAMPLTGSAAMSEKLYQKYLQEFADAKAVDGQQGSPQNIISNDLTDIR